MVRLAPFQYGHPVFVFFPPQDRLWIPDAPSPLPELVSQVGINAPLGSQVRNQSLQLLPNQPCQQVPGHGSRETGHFWLRSQGFPLPIIILVARSRAVFALGQLWYILRSSSTPGRSPADRSGRWSQHHGFISAQLCPSIISIVQLRTGRLSPIQLHVSRNPSRPFSVGIKCTMYGVSGMPLDLCVRLLMSYQITSAIASRRPS